MKILAIDPGFERIGIAILDKNNLIYSNCFKTSSVLKFSERLNLIGSEINKIIKEYKPDNLAIEKLYFSTNQKTVMGVSEARGVIIYEGIKNNLGIFEYTPPQIKLAVTGYGRSDKSAVMSMVPKLININKNIKSDDELDAIAIGITCIAHEKFK